jgi:hypothetical protein
VGDTTFCCLTAARAVFGEWLGREGLVAVERRNRIRVEDRDGELQGWAPPLKFPVLCISRHQSRMEYEVSCPIVAAFG